MRKTPVAVLRVAEDLKARCPDGPPYCFLVVSEASLRCLVEGVVNARVEVEAHRVLQALEAASLPQHVRASLGGPQTPESPR